MSVIMLLSLSHAPQGLVQNHKLSGVLSSQFRVVSAARKNHANCVWQTGSVVVTAFLRA